MFVTVGTGMFGHTPLIFSFGMDFIGKMWDNLKFGGGETNLRFLLIYSSYFILYVLIGILIGLIIRTIKKK